MEAGPAEVYTQTSPPVRPDAAWVAIGASVQGASHLQAGLPCQDFLAYRSIDENTLAAVISDGLGSEPRSQQGARLATEACLAFLEAELHWAVPNDLESWRMLLQESFAQARFALEEIAQQEQAELKEYGATLLVLVVSGEWLATGHIGDGAAVAWLEDGSFQTISAPQSGEYINETFPLTMQGALERVEYSVFRQRVKALALMTDGMCHLSLRKPDDAPHPPFFQPLFSQLPNVTDAQAASMKLAAFMESERVCALTDDDKTLVLIGNKQA